MSATAGARRVGPDGGSDLTVPQRLPNLIIAGVQKAGTTWLHHTLKKSSNFQQSDVKEVDYFLRADYASALDEYAAHFPGGASERYVYESSPNYFRPRTPDRNVPERISSTLDSPEVILLFRDPVDRYLSAYIHHMAAGRLPYSEVIDDVNEGQQMVVRGYYATLLEPWVEHLPQTRFYLYDDLTDKPALVDRVMGELGVENDIPIDELDFEVNSAAKKLKKFGWPSMPRLSDRVRDQLVDLYAPEVDRLQSVIGRDLSNWLGRSV